MNKILLISAAVLFSLSLFVILIPHSTNPDKKTNREKKPSDWFFRQRAFPFQDINHQAYREGVAKALEMKKKYKNGNDRASWDFAGPLNIGGRVTAVAMHPQQMQTFYIGAASGGIFKTGDGGDSWIPVFDDQPSLSIGDLALAPSDPDIIYVGTGEANAGGGSLSYEGLGIFKSIDGGTTWDDMGLTESGSIGRLVIHPEDPGICYVAAMGRMFSENSQRGVFKTTNGGESWEQVLYVNDSTGAIDIVIHPDNPEILYAAMWERVRRPDRRSYGGLGCGIYKSTDGGENWEELTAGLPTGQNVGRIGISISPSDPEILYAIYADKIGYFDGVFKTTNGGNTWTQTNDGSLSNMYASYGWWFGRIEVDPVDPDIVYGIGFDLYKTSNGGNSWSNISGWSVHVDQHDLNAHPENNDYVVLGNDGGVYISQNGGSSFTHLQNLPITQFYTCEIDYQNPERLYGGTQDNGTNRTMTGNPDDWNQIYGGDGFYVLVNPDNNQYVYAESQYGGLGRSTNGGSYFSYALNGIGYSDRFNWMAPLVFNPSDPSVLYFGSNKLYKSTNHAANWSPVSDDLTNGPGQFNQTYGTITTIAVSAVDDDVIWAGTDDGNVWVTQDDGDNWTNVSWFLPLRWVTRVATDPYEAGTAIVTFSGYRYDEYIPHVYRTTDFGQGWDDISGDLPEVPVNDVIIDPTLDSALYVATDVGVFVSWNLGQNWGVIGDGLPNVPICDLTFHDELRLLVVATYGRSMYSIELGQFVDIADHQRASKEINVYPNPASEFIRIDLNGYSAGTFRVSDLQGRIMMRGRMDQSKGKHIDISGLESGTYFFVLENDEGERRCKFIRE